MTKKITKQSGESTDSHFVGFQLTFELSKDTLEQLEADLSSKGIAAHRAGQLMGKHILYVDVYRALEAVDMLEKYDDRRCPDLRKELKQWTR